MSLDPLPTAPSDENEVRLSSIGDFNTEFYISSGLDFALFIETVSSEAHEKAALIQFEFYDNNDQAVPNPAWRPVSKTLGAFQYLKHESANEFTQHRIDLVAPDNAVKVKLAGHQWNENISTQVVGDVQIQIPTLKKMVSRYPSGAIVPFPSQLLDQTAKVPDHTSFIDIELTYLSNPGVKSLTPIQVIFLDKDRKYIPGISALPQNINFGSFLPLAKTQSDPETYKVSLQLPPDTAYLRFVGVDWKMQGATLYGGVQIKASQGKEFSLEKWIDNVPEESQLIVIDTTAPPLGHETLSLRPNNLSAAYARLGANVIFLPFGSLQEFQHRVSEKLVQVPRDEFPLLLDLLLRKRTAKNSIFISSSFPSINSVTAAKRLKATGWTVIYEARDDMEEFRRVGYSKWYEPQLERQMLRIADRVVSVSSALDEKLVSLWPSLQNHVVIPNGVNSHVIEASKQLRSDEAIALRNKSRVVGYVGHLTPSWFDWELINSAARSNPDVTFEIVGHGKPDDLSLPSNVHYLGPKTHDELPPIVAKWKCGLIPFKDLPLTRSVDPNKIYEYFAWGLRCLTAPMGLVHKYPSTWVHESVREFNDSLMEILDSDITVEEMAVLEDFLQSASWDHRAEQMMMIFNSVNNVDKD